MNKKTILIIILALAIIVGASVILYEQFNHKEQVTTVKLGNTCSINITGEYETKNMTHGITKIIDKKGNNITHFNSEGKGLSDISAFADIKLPIVGETYDTGATPLEANINGTTKWVCFTGNNQTHDNILIISNSKEDAVKLHDSIKYNTTHVNNSTVNNTVEKINSDDSSSQSSSSQSSSSQSSSSESSKVMVKREDGPGYMEMDRDKAYYKNGEWWADKS